MHWKSPVSTTSLLLHRTSIIAYYCNPLKQRYLSRQSSRVCQLRRDCRTISRKTILQRSFKSSTPDCFHDNGLHSDTSSRLSSCHRILRTKQITEPNSRHTPSPLFLHRSSFDIWVIFGYIGLATGAIILYEIYFVHPKPPNNSSRTSKRGLYHSPEDPVTQTHVEWNTMTGEALPGRPGNLTPDQEEGLRQLWIATLQVFGVLESTHGKDFNGDNRVNTPSGSKADSLPEKKKRRFFGRKVKDSDGDSTASNESHTHSKDTEDKYGLNRQFHDTLAQQLPETLRATFWSMVKHDHPDALLLRFLRARKWDVDKALVMMISTMNWRHTDVHVDDDVIKNGELAASEASKDQDSTTKSLGEDFLAQMRMGKSFLHGTDSEGRPMCIVRVRLHKQGEQSEASLERYTVFLIETARMVLAPPVDTACIVFDMTGFSLANMDYSPVKFMIKCFEANYPESLGVVLVHKAPWVFQGIWKIIKGWLDPVVASKIKFTSSVEEMEHYIGKSHIPKDMGGDEDWAYQYIEPKEGENDLMKDAETRDKLLAGRASIVNQYEKATLEWIDESKGPEAAKIKELRHKLAQDLRVDYWNLDPYVRARSLYDRTGVIRDGGVVDFYASTQPLRELDLEPPNGLVNGTAAASE